MPDTLTDADVRYSHLVADTEAARTKALRSAQRIDSVIADLRHAIENGRTDAALDLLITVDTANRAVLDTLRTPAT
jgi:hypothetical protein